MEHFEGRVCEHNLGWEGLWRICEHNLGWEARSAPQPILAQILFFANPTPEVLHSPSKPCFCSQLLTLPTRGF